MDANFNGQIFRKDFPMVIATNRAQAILLAVRLRYDADGYVAGQTLARNTTDGRFQKYVDGAASGTGTAACVLFESVEAEKFDGTTTQGSTTAVGIFGGCTLYKDKLIGWDAAAATDLGAKDIIDASGVTLVKF